MNTIRLNTIGEVIAKKDGGNSGGGAVSVSPKAVNFRDYDGTILHSYTKEGFLALTKLSPLPTREGLICQEWNWDFADAVEYVTESGVLEVGATYITDDGKTKLYITIAAEGRMDVPLYFNQSVANGVTIDWGDGSASETLSGTGNVNTTHRYSAIGDYVISLDVVDGCTLGLGHNSSSYCIMGSTEENGRVYCNMLQMVEIGKEVTSIGDYAFNGCYSLASVVIPQEVTSIGDYAFNGCGLASVVIPQEVTSIGDYAFYGCGLASVVIPQGVTSIGEAALSYCFLASVVIPQEVTSIGDYAFEGCSLASVVIPQGVTSISDYAFNGCYSLASVVIPQGVTSIGDTAFCMCESLASVVIPQGVTSISDYAFYECFGIAFYDFSALEAVPTLSNITAFSSIPSDCKIIVPDALYDTWIVTTNWNAYASNIIKKSEWDTLNA